MWKSYMIAMDELYRVLKMGGILVMKCQDSVFGRKQYLVHVHVIQYAWSIKFYPKDMFLKLQEHVCIGHNHHNQQHCRKAHCYYIVFEKKRRVVRLFKSKEE